MSDQHLGKGKDIHTECAEQKWRVQTHIHTHVRTHACAGTCTHTRTHTHTHTTGGACCQAVADKLHCTGWMTVTVVAAARAIEWGEVDTGTPSMEAE